MIGAPPICLQCKHFNPKSGMPYTCTAFPDGISAEIMSSLVVHDKPIPGDNGIQYEPKEEFAPK